MISRVVMDASVPHAGPVDASLDELGRALAIVGHELRTPLTVILGLADFLTSADDEIGSEQRVEMLETIAKTARHLDVMLSDLVDIDRDGLGLLVLRRALTDVPELVERVASRARLRSDRAIDVSSGRQIANIDSLKVEHIIENLLVNAEKYSPPGGSITVVSKRMRGGVFISVSDLGRGVADIQKKAIFKPYARGTTASDRSGYGVGLAIVASFVALHGGRVWVTDRVGGGSTFNVFLPLATEETLRSQ